MRATSGAPLLLGATLLLGACVAKGPMPVHKAPSVKPGTIVDTHAHLAGTRSGPDGPMENFGGAAKAGIRAKNRHNIAFSLLMPPPFSPDTAAPYGFEVFRSTLAKWPGRFAFVGGGGTLNPMIHATPPGDVDTALRKKFTARAHTIIQAGAKGFGELTALHLSFHDGHAYIESPPDHPLFLLLADIAARHELPLDIHMEAVARDRDTPSGPLRRSSANPPRLKANLARFERLLAHNRRAKIIWAHAGWDNTGERTPALLRRLLATHSNLFLAINVGPRPHPPNQMLSGDEVDKEWLALIGDYPKRFMMGMDTFHRQRNRGSPLPNTIPRNRRFFDALPADLQRAVGYENAVRIFKLDGDR